MTRPFLAAFLLFLAVFYLPLACAVDVPVPVDSPQIEDGLSPLPPERPNPPARTPVADTCTPMPYCVDPLPPAHL